MLCLGLGYIGLHSCCPCNAGHEVLGIDINEKVVNSLSNSEVHITEPGLNEIVLEKLELKKLKFLNKLKPLMFF